jgi:hypothetical protein
VRPAEEQRAHWSSRASRHLLSLSTQRHRSRALKEAESGNAAERPGATSAGSIAGSGVHISLYKAAAWRWRSLQMWSLAEAGAGDPVSC